VSESPLRRHIDALLADNPGAVSAELQRWLAPTSESQVEQIAAEQIHDREWRGEVDTADPAYRALKASVRASGVLQPLLLRPRPEGGFEVVAGVRRLRATRETGQATVPALVRELGDLAAIVGGAWEALSRTGITMAEARALTARLQSAGMAKAESVALVATLPRVALPAGEPPPAQSHRAAPTPRGGPAVEDLPAVPVVGRAIGQHPPEAMSVEPAREVVPVEPTAAAEEMSTPTAVLERAPEAAAPQDAPAAADITNEDVTPGREDGSSADAEPTASVGSAAEVPAAAEPQAGEASDDTGAPAVVAPPESPPSTHAPIVISITTPGDKASEAEAEPEPEPEPESPSDAAPESPPVTAPGSAAAEQAGDPLPAVPPAPAPPPPPPPQMSARAPARSRLQATRQPATALPAASHSSAPADAEGLGNPLWYTPYALGVAVGALVFLILSIQQGETGRPLVASAVVMAVALLLAMASLALARRRL